MFAIEIAEEMETQLAKPDRARDAADNLLSILSF